MKHFLVAFQFQDDSVKTGTANLATTVLDAHKKILTEKQVIQIQQQIIKDHNYKAVCILTLIPISKRLESEAST